MNNFSPERKPLVLIVEDDLENRKYFELILKSGFRFDFCDSKKSMYNLLSKKNFDVIIMDISLKDGNNGIEIIKELKRSTSNINIPVICLSAFAYNDEEVKAKEAGADIYLTKPVKSQQLVTVLNKLVNKKVEAN